MMGRWIGVVLVVVSVLFAPCVSAQSGQAQLETLLTPQRVTVDVEENQTLELRIDARLQCLPEHDGPRDLHGYFTRKGHENTPVYWALDPAEIRVAWHEAEDDLWVINETVEILVHADTPASGEHSGEQATILYINGHSSGSIGSCTPAGYSWEPQSLPLTVVVPATAQEGAEGDPVQTAEPESGRLVTPLKAAVVFLVVLLLTYLVTRWKRRRR